MNKASYNRFIKFCEANQAKHKHRRKTECKDSLADRERNYGLETGYKNAREMFEYIFGREVFGKNFEEGEN